MVSSTGTTPPATWPATPPAHRSMQMHSCCACLQLTALNATHACHLSQLCPPPAAAVDLEAAQGRQSLQTATTRCTPRHASHYFCHILMPVMPFEHPFHTTEQICLEEASGLQVPFPLPPKAGSAELCIHGLQAGFFGGCVLTRRNARVLSECSVTFINHLLLSCMPPSRYLLSTACSQQPPRDG